MGLNFENKFTIFYTVIFIIKYTVFSQKIFLIRHFQKWKNARRNWKEKWDFVDEL